MKRIGVIMAGGSATRLWPLARANRPKQLLNLTGDGVLINQSVERLERVIPMEDIHIVTGRNLAEAMKPVLTGRIPKDNVLTEPEAKNTAACVCFAATSLMQKYGDCVMVITPSDHEIQNLNLFDEALNEAMAKAEAGNQLVTVGVKPTYPATGYGYIQRGEGGKVLSFREKPDEESAEKYLQDCCYLWNSGMFIWKASAILRAFADYAPDIYDLFTGRDMTDKDALNRAYELVRKISVDYAVMEPAAAQGRVSVVEGCFGWSDIGTWDALGAMLPKDENGNSVTGECLLTGSTNCVCYSTGRMISLIGCDNLVVVETPDAVLVCPKEWAQQVGNTVRLLKEIEKTENI